MPVLWSIMTGSWPAIIVPIVSITHSPTATAASTQEMMSNNTSLPVFILIFIFKLLLNLILYKIKLFIFCSFKLYFGCSYFDHRLFLLWQFLIKTEVCSRCICLFSLMWLIISLVWHWFITKLMILWMVWALHLI